jgi:hypothetical protein
VTGVVAGVLIITSSFLDAQLCAEPESRHCGARFRVHAEPVIGPRIARTRWRAPE